MPGASDLVPHQRQRSSEMADIIGTDGDDTITTDTPGDDTIDARGGNDIIGSFRGGFDIVNGGLGRDMLVFNLNYTIRVDYAPPLSRGAFTLNSVQAPDGLVGIASWFDGADVTAFNGIEDVFVFGLTNEGHSGPGGFDDFVKTGAGDDTIAAAAGGFDRYHLGAGFDVLEY